MRPRLEPYFALHAVDRRGGRSASGDGTEYAVEREHEDVAAVADAVAEAARTEVDVLGSSAGASFAVAAAALTTSIRRLVLFEPPTEGVLRLLPAELHERLDALLDAGDREGVLTTAYRTVAGLSDEEIEQLRAQPEWPNRLAAAHTVPRELRIAPERLFDAERVRSVTVPTLVLVGGDTPPAFRTSAEEVASALPNATLVVLPGQGHGAELRPGARRRAAARVPARRRLTPGRFAIRPGLPGNGP